MAGNETAPAVAAEPTADAKPATDAKPAADVKPAVDAKPATDVKPTTDAKPAADVKPTTDAKPAADVKPTTDAKPAADVKPTTDAKPVADAKPAPAAEPAKDATRPGAAKRRANGGKPRKVVKKAPPRRAKARGGVPVKKAATGVSAAATVAELPVATKGRGAPPKRAMKAHARRAASAGWVKRVFPEPNTDGPRVRVGLVWFLLLLPAAYVGARPVAALFGLLAGVAALQSGQSWRRAGYRPSRLVAAPFAVAMPVAAVSSYSLPGVVVVVLPFVALAAAFLVPRKRRRTSAFGAAGLTILCAALPGVAAMGMVFTARLGVGACMVFVVLISAYDVGSFLVGAEASSPSHGIIAGSLCVLVATAPVFAFQLPPFDGETAAWVFSGMIAVLAPLGQILSAVALPNDTWFAPALRRLDAYVLTAPLWAWSLWSYLG